MKKYLMLGIAAVAIGAAFTSCNKNDVEPVSAGDMIQAQYKQAFINTFGQPAANQTWGFSSRQLPALTRAAQPNGNQWGTNDNNGIYKDYPQPDPITNAELAKVLAVFNQKGETSYESLIDWENFFVQQVYTGPNGSKMNELATTVDYTVETTVISWWPFEATTTRTTVAPFDDIINNFNAGNCTAWDGCMLMFNSATDDFSFKTSQGGGQRWYNHWRMEKIDNNYYVGFDHESAKQGSDANENEEDLRDYIYNDWIVKIVPGRGVTPPARRYEVRVICEDLNATSGTDFDFNDVVFDAVYSEGQNQTSITIQAAGGTLPLYVAGKEVHALFAEANPDKNISVSTMINTNASNGISGLDPVSFTIAGLVAPKDIEITVNRDGELIPLKSETGQPTAKIAVDPSFVWCDERSDIRTVYSDFANYVKNGDINWY